MFQAGLVTPSSVFLLQLLTPPGGDLGAPAEVLDVLEPPVKEGLRARSAGGRERGLNVLEPLAVLFELGPLFRPKPGDINAPVVDCAADPVAEGLSGPPAPRFGPIVVGKLVGLTALAMRLKALRHCKTCAGSFDS